MGSEEVVQEATNSTIYKRMALIFILYKILKKIDKNKSFEESQLPEEYPQRVKNRERISTLVYNFLLFLFAIPFLSLVILQGI